jgi:hypothetical protein
MPTEMKNNAIKAAEFARTSQHAQDVANANSAERTRVANINR